MSDDRTSNDQRSGVEDGAEQPDADKSSNGDLGLSADGDDPHKAEKLAKAGRDIDPDDGAD